MEEIHMLEATKSDLQNKLAQQSKENLRLKDEVAKRKNTLQERRLALENEVTRLQEQLEKERELRKTLEAGLKSSSSMDKMVKSDFEEIAQSEVDIGSLKQKADGLAWQLNQQQEQNSRIQDDVDGHEKHEAVNENAPQNQQTDQSQNKKFEWPLPSTLQEGPVSSNTKRSSSSELYRADLLGYGAVL